MAGFGSRLKHAWNVFITNDPLKNQSRNADLGVSHGSRPDRVRLRYSNERSIISSIYNRLSVDAAGFLFRHVRVDENDRYSDTVKSDLNECLTVRANKDQMARASRQDMVMTLLEEGTIAIVPIDTTAELNVSNSTAFDIQSFRVARIVQWWPDHVTVSVYRESTGKRENLTIQKKYVAIVENPFYAVMNEPNSTLQRLIRKLNLLDTVDEANSSGKLDLIIQLPYVIKSEARREQAEQRRKDIEFQLKGSQYGIAYTDGTEKITQLNRAVENTLLKQVEYLTALLYSQLGITDTIMNGTADDKTMLNYYNRTIEPILDAIAESMRWAFLTKTARTQGQSIMYFRDPFKLVPVNDIAEIADKFTRNEIASSNDIRAAIGMRPSKDPKADELRNSNMPAPSENPEKTTKPIQEGDSQNGS